MASSCRRGGRVHRCAWWRGRGFSGAICQSLLLANTALSAGATGSQAGEAAFAGTKGPAAGVAQAADSAVASAGSQPVVAQGAASATSPVVVPAAAAAPAVAAPAAQKAAVVAPTVAEPPAVVSPPVAGGKSASCNAEIEALKAQLAAESLEKRRITDEATVLRARVAALAQDVSSQTAQVTKLKSSSEALEGEKKQLVDEKAQLTEGKAQVESERDKLRSELDTKKGESVSQQTQITRLSEESKAKAKEMEELMQLKATLANEKATIQSELSDVKAGHEELKAQYRDLESRYADPSVQHFLTRKAIKAYHHPGIQGAANKTFTYIVPSLLDQHLKGQLFLNKSHALVHSKLNAYIDDSRVQPYLPAVSGFLVYGLVICPLMCTTWCLTRVVCRLRPGLLFLHLYFALTALCAAGFAVYTGMDPLAVFAMHDASVYLVAQFGIATGFLLYSISLSMACACSQSGMSEFCFRCTQFIIFTLVSAAYYMLVWTPAMMDEKPMVEAFVRAITKRSDVTSLIWLPYLVASLLFFMMLRMEQLTWRARGPGAKAGKADATPSISLREDGELRGMELARILGNQEDLEAATKQH